MGKKENKKKQDCGCGDENCTCGENCQCTEENNCGCDCWKEKEHEHKCDCGCEHDDCDCDDDCDCGCHEGHCDCGCDHEHEYGDRAEEFKAYQKAFDQFEKALEQVDRELTIERARAEKNEHLADAYKKDLERYKERNKDIEKISRQDASISIAGKILPILDNFEQALKTVKDENVMIGFKMIQSGIKNILTDMDIVEIDALGKEFDPAFHDAVNRIQTKDKNLDGKVAGVYKTGYMLGSDNTRVIRHAQVEIYCINK